MTEETESTTIYARLEQLNSYNEGYMLFPSETQLDSSSDTSCKKDQFNIGSNPLLIDPKKKWRTKYNEYYLNKRKLVKKSNK